MIDGCESIAKLPSVFGSSQSSFGSWTRVNIVQLVLAVSLSRWMMFHASLVRTVVAHWPRKGFNWKDLGGSSKAAAGCRGVRVMVMVMVMGVEDVRESSVDKQGPTSETTTL